MSLPDLNLPQMSFGPVARPLQAGEGRMRFPDVTIQLPPWIEPSLPPPDRLFAGLAERMGLVIELARLNVAKGTGGPFAAGIFEQDSGRLLAVGVNLVVPANCAIAHAEMVAIAVAQRIAGTYDLSKPGLPSYDLFASAEPCAMCLGAVPWSGVRRLVYAARDEDVRAIGFDEGRKPPDWTQALHDRGITVIRDVLREPARAVLCDYQARGGLIYNCRQG